MLTVGPKQRLRITFGRGEDVKYITHLDLMRLWERLLRRAGLPVSHSVSQPPRPRLALAAPLAVGVTSEGELMEVFLDTRLPLAPLARRLAAECPAGITVREVQEIGLGLPSLQSLVRFSEYEVALEPVIAREEMQQRLSAFLSATSLPRQRLRDKEIRRYDLRPLVDSLWLAGWSKDEVRLGMRLQTDEQATGRPDEVLAGLGLSEGVRSIHRVKLLLAAPVLKPQRAAHGLRHG